MSPHPSSRAALDHPLTIGAVESVGIGKKDAERSKNMFALGVLSWMYGRPLAAIEEFLRFDSPAGTSTPRFTSVPITVGDVEIPANEFVMISVLWMILAGMGVFDQVNGLVGQIIQDGENTFDIMDFLGFGRVVSLAIVVGVIDVILMTALATLAAFLYNVSSSLVGGLQLTLTDD